MKRIFQNRMFTSVLLSVVLTFAFVFAVAYSATTISTSITTGGSITAGTGITVTTGGVTVTAGDLVVTAGNLTVTAGTVTLTPITANSVIFAGTAGLLSQDNTNFNWVNATDVLTARFASSTAMSATSINVTNFVVAAGGKIGVGTTTPVGEISVTSSTATTTLYLDSTATAKGGCIQLKAADGTTYRMYVMRGGTATTAPNTGAGFIAVWEPGACIGTQ